MNTFVKTATIAVGKQFKRAVLWMVYFDSPHLPLSVIILLRRVLAYSK